jgi:hypothetical protein
LDIVVDREMRTGRILETRLRENPGATRIITSASAFPKRAPEQVSALLGLPEDLGDLVDLGEQLVSDGDVVAGLRAATAAGKLGRLVEQLVELGVLLEVTVTVSGTPPSVFPGGPGPLTRTASGPLELLGEGAIP